MNVASTPTYYSLNIALCHLSYSELWSFLDQKAHYVFDLFVVVGRGGTNSLMFAKCLVFCDVW